MVRPTRPRARTEPQFGETPATPSELPRRRRLAAGTHPDYCAWQQWLSLSADERCSPHGLVQFEQLCAALRHARDFAALSELHLGRLDAESDPDARAAVVAALGAIFERDMLDPGRALTTLLFEYAARPDVSAWPALVRLSAATDRWEEAVEAVFGTQVEAPADELAVAWVEFGRACAARGDNARAIAAYRRSIECDASARDGYRLLAALLRERAEYGAAIDVMLAHAAAAPAHECLAIVHDVGALYLDVLDNRAAAVEHYEQALVQHPFEPSLLARLADLHTDADDPARRLEVLSGLVSVTDSAAERVALYERMAALCEHGFGSARQAAECYEWIASEAPSARVYGELARLYEAARDWQAAVDAHGRRAREVSAPERALVMVRIAEIYEVELAQPGEAIQTYRRAEPLLRAALVADPSDPACLRALGRVYLDKDQPWRAIELLERAMAASADDCPPLVLVDAGAAYEAHGNDERALALYERALAIQPDEAPATRRCIEVLWRLGRYDALVPVLERWVDRDDGVAAAHEDLVRLCFACTCLGQAERARAAYARAQAVESARAVSTANGELAGWYALLATCEARVGSREAAVRWLRQSLDIEPTVAAVALADDLALTVQVRVDARRALLESAEAPEQARLLCEIGELYQQAERVDEAIRAYRQALILAPGDRHALHQCLTAYVSVCDWRAALGVIGQLVELERESGVRGRLRETAGFICRDELRDEPTAMRWFREALADDAGLDRAASALEDMARRGRHWRVLAALYCARIRHFADGDDQDDDERLRLWAGLSDACRHDGDVPGAVAALEVAVHLDPMGVARRAKLAALYSIAGLEYLDKAIAAHQHLLDLEPARGESYRELAKLYVTAGQPQRARRCVAALDALVARELVPASVRITGDAPALSEGLSGPLDASVWAVLRHPSESLAVSRLCALATPVLAASHRPRHALGNARRLVAQPDQPMPLLDALRYCAAVLGLSAPALYEAAGERIAMAAPAQLTGRAIVPLFVLDKPRLGGARAQRELLFELTRRLCHFRSACLVRMYAPDPRQLACVLAAAMQLAGDGPRTRIAQLLATRLAPIALDEVVALGQELRVARALPIAVARTWLRGVDLTAARVATAVSGLDPERCASIVQASPLVTDPAVTGARVTDVVRACVADLKAARPG